MSDLTRQSTAVQRAADSSAWERAAASWFANLRSEHTRKAYGVAWRQFIDFTAVQPPDATEDHAIAWAAHLRDSDYSQATINAKIAAVSSFYSYAKRRGLLAMNPFVDVAREDVTPYGKATALDTAAGDDVRLVASIDTATEQGKRDKAIILLLLSRALRVGSVSKLRYGDLRSVGGRSFVTVTLKGGGTKELPIAQETAVAIRNYLATRGELSEADPLFVATAAGSAAAALLGYDTASGLTPQAIRAIVKSRCNAVFGRGHGITPHSLRHTAATRASRNGATVKDVSKLLTHKNRATTLIYLDSMGDREDDTAVVDGLGAAYRGI